MACAVRSGLLRSKDNCDLKSAGFDTKKEIYKKTPYELTSQLGLVSDWTDERIEERQIIMAKFALKAWPL